MNLDDDHRFQALSPREQALLRWKQTLYRQQKELHQEIERSNVVFYWTATFFVVALVLGVFAPLIVLLF